MEASHGVVQYFWVQKTWKLRGDHNFGLIYTALKFLTVNWKHLKLRNRKCRLVTGERYLLSRETFTATEARKADVISSKNL